MDAIDPPRGFAFAWFKINGVEVGIYCVHLKSNLIMRGDKAAEGAKNIRKREVASEQLLDHIQTVVASKMPTVRSFIIGGDFNTNADEFADEATLTRLEQNGFQSCMEGLSRTLRVTHPGGHGYPDTTFDYLFAKGATIDKPMITRSEASDHLPVTCNVTLSATGVVANNATAAQSPAVATNGAPEPATPSAVETESTVTLTQPVTIKIAYGETTLPAGTKLPVVSRDGQTVLVRYMGQVYPLPLSRTDLH
jgi:hypothetical protein